MKAGSHPPKAFASSVAVRAGLPAFINFFRLRIRICIRGRIGSAAACKAVALCGRWGFESLLMRSEGAYVKDQTGELQISLPGPVAQMDKSASLRSLRSQVRVLPGSLIFRGRPEGGRLSLEQETRVRVLPPEPRFDELGWRKGKRAALRSPRASPIEGSIPSPSIPLRGSGANGRHTVFRRRLM